MSTKFNEIVKDVINIYDEVPHQNQKCQDIKEDWTKHCFYSENNKNKKHKEFLFFKGSQTCNELFNGYYKCFVKDKIERNNNI
jgi:hypothetical protein